MDTNAGSREFNTYTNGLDKEKAIKKMEKAEMHIKKEQEWLMDSLRALGLDGHHHHLAKEELNQSGTIASSGGGGGQSSGSGNSHNGHNGLNSSLQSTTQSAE